MVYLVTSSEYKYRSCCELVYVSKNLNKIFDMLKNNEFNNKLNNYTIEFFEINKRVSSWSNSENKYDIDLKKRIVTDKNNKIIFNFNNENQTNKTTQKEILITKCKNILYIKQIPENNNNYFSLIYDIENSSDNNIDEDIDYLTSILIELEMYNDKPNVSY